MQAKRVQETGVIKTVKKTAHNKGWTGLLFSQFPNFDYPYTFLQQMNFVAQITSCANLKPHANICQEDVTPSTKVGGFYFY